MSDFDSVPAGPQGRDQRRHRRYLTLATARIPTPGTSIDCAVLNVSAGGACLLVTDAAVVPDDFELVLDPGRGRVRCTLAWRNRHRVGVIFVAADTTAPA